MAETIKEVYIENKLDYGKFILEPKSQDTYKEITKDFATSHLDKTKLAECELRQEILNIIVLSDAKPWLPRSFESFERDQQTILQLHRSKLGFQSKLEKANLVGDTTDMKGFDKEKTKTIFNKKEN